MTANDNDAEGLFDAAVADVARERAFTEDTVMLMERTLNKWPELVENPVWMRTLKSLKDELDFDWETVG